MGLSFKEPASEQTDSSEENPNAAAWQADSTITRVQAGEQDPTEATHTPEEPKLGSRENPIIVDGVSSQAGLSALRNRVE